MNYKQFYEIAENGYKRQCENAKPSLYSMYDKSSEYLVKASLGKARGPMFREADDVPLDYIASFETLGDSRRFLRDDIYNGLRKYEGKEAEYIRIYASLCEENDRKLFALYATLLLQFYEELNKCVVNVPANEVEKHDLAARIMPLVYYINYIDGKWHVYGCVPFRLDCTDPHCQTYLLICDVMRKHLADCEMALKKLDTKEKIKQNKMEYTALKQRGDGAFVPQDAMLRNRFCICGLLDRAEYPVDPIVFSEINTENFAEPASFSDALDRQRKKALNMFLYVVSMFVKQRNELLLKYDAAKKSGDEKELWVSGIRIEAYNEMLNGLLNIAEINGGKLPWQK